MNFGRAKTILIILFALVNLFLIGYMFTTSSDITTPNSKTISDTIKILNERNIFLDKKINLKKSDNINSINLNGITTDEKVLASKLLGAFYIKNGIYTSESGDLTISNGEFLWNVKDNHTFKEFNEESVLKYAFEFLSDHEIDISTLKPEEIKIEDGNYKITFNHYFFDKELFNIPTYIYVSGGGVFKMEGRVFTLDSLSESEKFTNNPINVLLSYSSTKEKSEKIEIIEINGGYYSENNTKDFKSISAIPCYEIILKSGQKHYFDAVSAKIIK